MMATERTPVDAALLALLRCPVSGGPLREASEEEIVAANARAAKSGTAWEPVGAGLISERARLIYPVRTGIPVLLADEAIPLD